MSDQSKFTFGGDIVWNPTDDYIQRSHLKAFMKQHQIESFQQLMTRSTDDVPWFTDALLKYLDVQFQKPYSNVVDLSEGIQFPRWCVDGQLNIAYNCVDKWAENPETSKRNALIYEGEEGITSTLTYGELHQEVNRCVNALSGLGIGKGDAVALYMPMTPEIVIAFLAIVKIGAIILPLFSGFGVNAIAQRMKDVNAKCIFTADGVFRRGKKALLKPTVDQALADVPSLQHVIVYQRVKADIQMQPGRDHWWHELIPSQSGKAQCTPTSAEDTLMVIHTSGTTGKPKGAVHTHCGFPVKGAQDMAFGTDVHPGDIIYWMSDMGWMMGPWLVFGTTLLGATCFLYDGAPDFPGPDRLWEQVARHKINVLGVSPTLIRSLITHGDRHVKKHDTSSIRCFASTGEPWKPDPWLWLFNVVGEGKRPIINYSGGTEISGGIVMGNPIMPVKPTAFSGACPGIAADVVDESGNPIRNAVGELVIRAPWIGMTRGFWQDKQRYIDAYWSRFENTWVHGDWAAIDDDGMWYILGRSDDTIKVAGKRVGPAEVEAILVNHPSVSECAAIGVPDKIKGSNIACFCILSPGAEGSDELKVELREKVGTEMGKPLKPKEIKFVADLPKTRNGKIMRRIILKAYTNEELGDTSSLVNPEAIQDIKQAV
ncbi:MAG: AMP-binding protein [bacterium]|nr:AMP-binding protein [bacterium]